ncbi:GNAT family N-acetyltransferase [Flavonifractor plautii]|uniref:GNAT family N-acetyltransferase n=1 Tax=Flavonifractor plautii TaxID=292800 RepID=UPI001959C433|nr:GNAT family N-acetyltransferase [Flavonifractor plautii]MBM6664660.1 GNAT family N-acetyltransferase [Flavonifractor plautii]
MRRFVFRSPRLGFLACDPALAAPAAAFYRRNREAFAPFDPIQPEEFFTPGGQEERLTWDLEQAEAGRSFRFLLVLPRHPGKIIGLAGLNEIVRGAFQSCFISYKLDHTLWGQGYGAEAIAALTEWGFRNLGLHRVEANIMPRNLPSRRAAAKAGFEEEGLARRYLKINGVWEDHIHMVRRNDEEDL